MDEKLWNYIGKGEYINGIPARDLTVVDWARMSEDERVAVEQSPLYRRAPKPKDEGPAKPVAEEAPPKAAAAKTSGEKVEVEATPILVEAKPDKGKE